MAVLQPIWATKTETATRVRSRIEAVLDWARVAGHREGENPARWRGHLSNLLAARAKVQKVRHHPALPYAELPGFVATLKSQVGMSPIALQFLILTATRTSEALKACWAEFDMDEDLWIIPADRMKAGREHRVPLSAEAKTLLLGLEAKKLGEAVFPGMRADAPLSNMALLTLLRRMNRSDLTAHGFRSTFRDWAAEQTDAPREVAEMALAHVVSDKVEAAYRRSDLMEKRRSLMHEWGAFCGSNGQAASQS